MRQLVELQENYEVIQQHDAEVIVVFREDQEEEAGLQKSRQNSGAEFPLLSDLNKESSGAYSSDGFQTYVIDSEGVIRAVLDGTKSDRPMADEILSQLAQLGESSLPE